ncbi:hypothetical protein [Stenotrophomonas sp. NPDC077659]|uniref:hypothetical protein n=1 Tax=Stenotrophomonas sp. NPDC077659 TaxID=3390694 RepID=UPI003D029025
MSCDSRSPLLPAVQSRVVGPPAWSFTRRETSAVTLAVVHAVRNAPSACLGDLIRRSEEHLRLDELHQASRHLPPSSCLRLGNDGILREASPGGINPLARFKAAVRHPEQVKALCAEVNDITDGSLTAVRGCHLALFARSAAHKLEALARHAFPEVHRAAVVEAAHGTPVADTIAHTLATVLDSLRNGTTAVERII